MDDKELHFFLKFGYFHNFRNKRLHFDISELGSTKNRLKDLNIEELLAEAKLIWFRSFESLYKTGKHVIPISGGLDSRAVLATLMRFGEVSELRTFTFGLPGSYDFLFGRNVADKVGSKHVQLSLDDYVFNQEKEKEVARRTGNQTFLFHHPPLEILDEYYHDHSIWSGYLLDWITGSFQPKSPSKKLDNAFLYVAEQEKISRRFSLSPLAQDSLFTNKLITENKLVDRHILSYEEQIQLDNHVLKCLGPQTLFSGYNYSLISTVKDIYLFFMALPRELRENQKFYKIFLAKEFPELFSLPIKMLNGGSLTDSNIKIRLKGVESKLTRMVNKWRSSFLNPHINYLDLDKGMRERNDVRAVISSNINDIKKRGIVHWLNPEDLLEKHLKKKLNVGSELALLASLEIILKNKNI